MTFHLATGEGWFGSTQIVLLTLSLATIFVFHQLNKLTFWWRLGIKTPLPLPIVGNGLSLMFKAKRDYDLEWRNKFGKVYGYYTGTAPRLVIADAKILRKICIKDFQYFPNHHFDAFRNKYQLNFLVQLMDLRWKKVRALMSPTFTSGKIKRMFKLMSLCSDEMVSMVDKKRDCVMDAKQLVSLYAMDVITTCCYALKLANTTTTTRSNDENEDNKAFASRNDRNAFVHVAHNITKSRLSRILPAVLLPEWLLKLIGFSSSPPDYFDDLYRKAASVIEKRQSQNQSHSNQHNDYLQLLLDAKFGAKMELTDMDDKENHHSGLTKQSLLQDQAQMEREVRQQQVEGGGGGKIELTQLEIVSNVMFLLIVGYETTATLMAHFLYIQAHNVDIQDKLYLELKSILANNNNNSQFDYDSVTSATYLDACISETLRFMTPVFFMDRISSQDYYLEEYKMTIPKGTVLNLSYYSIMNDPDYWPRPEIFDPSRFFAENRHKIVPGSYCPFGLGPRHCIGYRFSLTEAKLGLARLLVKYQFRPATGSVFPPVPRLTTFLNSYKDLNVIPTLR